MFSRLLIVFCLVTILLIANSLKAASESEERRGCALMLLNNLDTQSTRSKSVAERVFSSFPLGLRRALARTSSQALSMHEATLQSRIEELLPPEVTAQMAAMFQKSYDYLMEWLPLLPRSMELGQKRYNKSKWENKKLEHFVSEAQKITWGQRLKEAHALLLEMVSLQVARQAPSSELGSTYLRLALLHSYTYGFQGYLVGERSPSDSVFDEGKGPLTVSGLEYYRRALEIFESHLGSQNEGLLTLKYLMLRHANNGISAHSNSQYRTFDWRRVQPDAIMSDFVDEAKKLSLELLRELGSDPTPTTFNSRRVLFYYVNRELHWGSYYMEVTGEEGSLFSESPSGRDFQKKALELLLLIAKEAPKSWIDDQLNDPHSKKFLSGLISDSRWYIQTRMQHPRWKLMYDLQLQPSKYNYESFLSILYELGLLQPTQLNVLGQTD